MCADNPLRPDDRPSADSASAEQRGGPVEPPVTSEANERADAARNRRKIIATAEDVVATRGVDRLSMNEVAAAAGVGVGTVYRRFGDRGSLIAAMMNERELRLQRAFRSGPPPLGPGAPPVERIRAFLHAYVDLLDNYAKLMAVAEETMPLGRRYGAGAYAVHHEHLTTLIAEAAPGASTEYLADALLASVSARLFVYQRQQRDMTTAQIKSGLDELLACFRT